MVTAAQETLSCCVTLTECFSLASHTCCSAQEEPPQPAERLLSPSTGLSRAAGTSTAPWAGPLWASRSWWCFSWRCSCCIDMETSGSSSAWCCSARCSPGTCVSSSSSSYLWTSARSVTTRQNTESTEGVTECVFSLDRPSISSVRSTMRSTRLFPLSILHRPITQQLTPLSLPLRGQCLSLSLSHEQIQCSMDWSWKQFVFLFWRLEPVMWWDHES